MSTQIVIRILVKVCLSPFFILLQEIFNLLEYTVFLMLSPPAPPPSLPPFMQALMAVPAPDFSLCFFLIPERVV